MSGSEQFIDQLKTCVLDISAFFAISINLLLIILIITKSPKSIGTYKHLMVYIAFFELAYAILYVAEKPDIFTRDSAFLIMTNTKESIFPVSISICLDVLFIGFYGLSISLLAIHFIYRYLAISNSYLLESFKNWKLLLWLLFPILNAAIWSYAAAVIFAATEDSDRFLKEFYLPNKKNGTQVGDIYYGGPFYYMTDRNGKFYVNWRAFEGTAIVLTLILLSFTTMILFGFKGYKTMKELMKVTSVSQKYKNLQSQLFNALLFQTIIPVFLMHIPATAIYFTIFLNISSEIFGEVLNFSIAMYPALNPLPTIFIVSSYKKAVTDFICCRKQVTPIDISLQGLNSQMMTQYPMATVSTSIY